MNLQTSGYRSKTHLPGFAGLIVIVLLSVLAVACSFAQDLQSVSKAAAPIARMSGIAAVANEKLYFIGGITKSMEATGVVHEYDPGRNDWSPRVSMPTPRGAAAAVELNGSIYVMGGRKDNDVLSVVEKYDPAGNSWSKSAPMPTARWHLMAAAVEGKIYAFGGIAGVGNARRVLDVIEVYDPTQDRWSSLPVMPVGNSNAGVAVVGRRIYLVGGRLRAGADASGSATGKVYVFDTLSENWETGPSMSEERTGLEACAVDGSIYAVGGASRGSNTRSVEVLSPGAKKWTLQQSLLRPRTDHSCALSGQSIYVVGGASAPSVDGIEATLEELHPSGKD